MPDPFLGKRPLPYIPKPEPHELKGPKEILTHVPEKTDHRPVEVKQYQNVPQPHFNQAYDSLGTIDINAIADNWASGTLLAVAGASASVAVNLANNPVWKVKQWPGSPQVYLMIRSFGIAPQTIPVTVGALDVRYVDSGGVTVPIGVIPSNSGGNIGNNIVCPSPIQDSGDAAVGTLTIILTAGASAVTYTFNMVFSALYLLPTTEGYYHVRAKGGPTHVPYEALANLR